MVLMTSLHVVFLLSLQVTLEVWVKGGHVYSLVLVSFLGSGVELEATAEHVWRK